MKKYAFAVAACAFLAACQRQIASSTADQARPEPVPVAPVAAAAPLALLAPEKAVEKAPDIFKARFTTTKGDFVIEVHRDWSPQGADRFYNLIKIGYMDDIAFFRAVDGFMVQLGINGFSEVNARWREAVIPDDPAKGISNKRGYVSFATAGPNTRTTQFFINYGDNSNLDSMGFTPFGQVTQGMEVVDSLYKRYGDGPPSGNGPDQGRLQMEGNAYLKKYFPQLDYVKTVKIEP